LRSKLATGELSEEEFGRIQIILLDGRHRLLALLNAQKSAPPGSAPLTIYIQIYKSCELSRTKLEYDEETDR